jgi:phosphoribosylaminoimidazole carboxylase
MLASSAALLNIDLVVLDVGYHAPAKQVFQSKAGHIDGTFSDPLKIQELASKSDVITVEIEHVNVDALEAAGENGGIQIHPSPSTLRTIQDKFFQKEHLARHEIPVSEYCSVDPTEQSLVVAGERLGFPLMLKSRTLAYDGRGNLVVKGPSDVVAAIKGFGDRPLYAEKWVSFVKEVAVMVVRSATGEVRSYPTVETVHKENICHLVFAPLRHTDPKVSRRAKDIAEKAIQTFEGAGVFGVEMFLLSDGMHLDPATHLLTPSLRFSSRERNCPSPA